MTSERPHRIESIDVLRGLVMVLMALDHVRDFFTNVLFDPLDLTQTWPALFVTRWVTHLCAPTFVFLAGTGAYLALGRGRTTAQVSRFLVTRGLWLVIAELTIIRFGWLFNWEIWNNSAGVIWAIGWSMVALALLVWLPVRAIGAFGIAMIALHNLLDPLRPEQFGSAAWLWGVLHEGAALVGGWVFVGYPLIPWIGVMAAGYAFGEAIRVTAPERRPRMFAMTGLALTIAFVVLRGLNIYGDPTPWSRQSNALFTLFSFVNTWKYPPSLLYLLMTLGPALLILAFLEKRPPRAASNPLLIFGRVPFFYYVMHLILIHGLAVLIAMLRGEPTAWLFQSPPTGGIWFRPAWYGYGLPVTYAMWIVTIALLYPLCRWFAGVKGRRRDWWMGYL